MTDVQWYLITHGPAGPDVPKPPADMIRAVLEPPLTGVMHEGEVAAITVGVQEGFDALDALIDDEALSLSGASSLAVILASAQAALDYGCPEEARNQLAYSYSAFALGPAERQELFALLREAGSAQQDSAPPRLWLTVLRALVRLATRCPGDAIRSVLRFPYDRFETARAGLWDHTTTYDAWCRWLRRLLVARRHFTTVALDEMTFVDADPQQQTHDGPTIEFGLRDDGIVAAFIPGPRSAEQQAIAQQLRSVLMDPFFTEDDAERFRQMAIVAEEAFAHALDVSVLGRSRRPTGSPVVAPPRDALDQLMESIRAEAAGDPVAARTRAREEYRLRLTIPRYAFDQLERHLTQKTP